MSDGKKTKEQLIGELQKLRRQIAELREERQRTETELLQCYQSQEVLNALFQLSLEEATLEEQLERALDVIFTTPWLSMLPKGSIFLVEDDPEVLVLKAQRGLPPSLQTKCARLPFGRCLCGRAAASGELQFADCVDHRHEHTYEGISPHGHYNVPILLEGEVVGVLNLYVEEGHRRDEREETFLKAVAGTLASLIKRKREEEELRRSHQSQEVLNALMRLSLEETSLEEQLERALDVILSTPWLPALPKGGIFLVEGDSGEIVLKAQRNLDDPLLTLCARVPFGRCLCGRAAASGKIQFADRVDDRHEIHFEGMAPHGHYSVPIVLDDRVVGVIVAYVEEGHRPNRQEEAFLEAVANTLAGLIKRKQAEEALQRAHDELERRVEERTRDLEHRAVQLQVAAEVARDAATAWELDTLLERAVNLVRDRFGFDHVGIFLTDERGGYALLKAATEEMGRQLLEQGYKLRIEDGGLVGSAIATGEPQVALDLEADGEAAEVPLLPHTRSEVVLPLKVGDQIIGALDVRSTDSAVFGQDDVAVLQIVADQLAVAIEKAHLLHEMEQTVHELEAAYGRYTQESWRAFVQSAGQPYGYRYRGLDVERTTELHPEAREALQQGRSVVTILQPEVEDGQQNAVSALAVPVKLRGQVIGVLNLRFEDKTILPETISLVEEAAGRLALVLESARLFSEAQARAERERLIADITHQVWAARDFQQIVETTLRSLSQVLGASEAVVRLQTNGQQEG